MIQLINKKSRTSIQLSLYQIQHFFTITCCDYFSLILKNELRVKELKNESQYYLTKGKIILGECGANSYWITWEKLKS